ncbi:MAG: hypothetical protein B6I34_07700 [Anaerolineaceae bacterium 4572_32.1]|nr:MAG: hypothetical protein B6I34_07700 [Anaerolineaceae bacterium 4572_32.1]
MKHYKTTVHCPVCDTKFLYALTEEETEENAILEAMCPYCGEMVDLEKLTPCSEVIFEDIIEVYEDLLEEDFEFDIEEFEEELDEDW